MKHIKAGDTVYVGNLYGFFEDSSGPKTFTVTKVTERYFYAGPGHFDREGGENAGRYHGPTLYAFDSLQRYQEECERVRLLDSLPSKMRLCTIEQLRAIKTIIEQPMP